MPASPALALQKAFYDTLTGSDFQAACGVAVAIYDHVPQTAALPYIVISDIQDDGCAAQYSDASELHPTVTVWSNAPGKVELQTIAHAVRTFLTPRAPIGGAEAPPFALTGHRLVTWRHLQTVPMNDPDGISSKAIVKLLFETEPQGS